MPFESTLSPLSPIIGDDNWRDFIDPTVDGEIKSRGLLPRDWSAQPFGAVAEPFSLSLIPESDWRGLIEEQEATQSSITHLSDAAGVQVKDQNGTKYCWINATVHAYEIARAQAGLPLIKFSPASVGAPIKNYSNVGGYGIEGLSYVIRNGVVPESLWPANAIDPRYDTAESRAERAKHKVTEWWEIPAGNFEALATALLLNHPVSAGYQWWGHQITCVRLVYRDGQFMVEIDNSWGRQWGTNGRGYLTRSKATPDDVAVVPRVPTA